MEARDLLDPAKMQKITSKLARRPRGVFIKDEVDNSKFMAELKEEDITKGFLHEEEYNQI